MQNKLYLTDLIGAKDLQKIQDTFSNMIGFAALTVDADGNAVTEGSNLADFCSKYVRKSDTGLRYCAECVKKGVNLAMEKGGPCAYLCHAGLVDFAAPIIAGGEIVGSFVGGQVLTEPPDLDKFAEAADRLGIDQKEYIESVKQIRIADKESIDKAARFFQVVASILSDMAYNGYLLHLSNIEIEKAARAKSDFLANMSHEIRTPMNAVLGMAELALREQMSPAAREYVHQIRSSGKNLLVIINDILDFSKIESGKMEIIPEHYEPMSMMNDLAGIVNSRIGSKRIEFTMDISPELPAELIGDNIRIQQILINLLNNAVKFTERGHIELKVDFERTDSDFGLIKASVSDTGRGIKQSDLGKLFQSFQQVDSKRNRNIEGTGLGLAITRRLLSLMDGSVSVESEYNVGSTFSLVLPQKVADNTTFVPKTKTDIKAVLCIENRYVLAQIEKDLDRTGVYHESFESAAENGSRDFGFFIAERRDYTGTARDFVSGHPGIQLIIIDEFDRESDPADIGTHVLRKPVYSLNLYHALGLIEKFSRNDYSLRDDFSFTAPDAHILIVDDNAVNLTVAVGLIKPLKMQVDTASSAAETINMINNERYDLIFMDHMMPEVDGVETTHIIRRLIPSYADVPIIALTANAVEGTREMFIREGMNDFVPKPIDTKTIVGVIKKWLPPEKIIPASTEP